MLWKIMVMSVKAFGSNILISPEILVDPYSLTCPSSFTWARAFFADDMPMTTPSSFRIRAAK